MFAKTEHKILNLPAAERALTETVRLPQTLLAWLNDPGRSEAYILGLYENAVFHHQADFWYHPETSLLAPIPRPQKNVLCIGKNYKDHAIEMGSEADIPEAPVVFTKAPGSVTGAGSAIELNSAVTEQLDYEGELAVVIGEEVKDVSVHEAENSVFGYTIINDITARDRQSRHKQFFLGKSGDTFCPMGPSIVTKDAMAQYLPAKIRTTVNGELRQDGTTEDLIFSVPELIAEISKGMTLSPGDIIATGTPMGVGKAMNPPRFLQDEDEVSVEIPGIGTLTNVIKQKA
ncbi:fumarylacetoacetate hydrolase family protein [Salsuginibacillus halophilus]|uniref:fumarylacetoacetate hydrolase family protein n=1 Tax=Salsuginibacillus halophilus TaxID=517424 RepID=UPI001FE95159|nr:fumarylacetoacetate hydrolase family protein [Salsuginibacillus halophilus]